MTTPESPAAGVPEAYTKRWNEEFYRREDPWGVLEHTWHLAKARRAVELLPKREYRFCLDLCCGEGTITKRYLAPRCRRILGLDYVPTAIDRAKAGNPGPGIEYRLADVLEFDYGSLRPGPDLVHISDVVFYFGRAQLDRLLGALAAIKSRPQVLIVSRLMYRQFCREHPDMIAYSPGYDCYETWDELTEMASRHFRVASVTPVHEYAERFMPWGDDRLSAAARRIFHLIFIKAFTRLFFPWLGPEAMDEMRFRLIRLCGAMPLAGRLARRMMQWYAIILKPKGSPGSGPRGGASGRP